MAANFLESNYLSMDSVYVVIEVLDRIPAAGMVPVLSRRGSITGPSLTSEGYLAGTAAFCGSTCFTVTCKALCCMC